MADWRAIVDESLAGLRLPAGRRNEICCELAAHLEDEHATLRARMAEDEAYRLTLNLLADPNQLIRQICDVEKEVPLNQRTRGLWVPGFVLLGVYTLMFAALVRAGAFAADPQLIFSGKVVLRLILGAVGAWWARSLGATPVQRAFVCLFPSLMTLVSLLIGLPVHAFKAGRSLWSAGDGQGIAMLVDGILIPAMALLLGAWPFLKGTSRPAQPSSSTQFPDGASRA